MRGQREALIQFNSDMAAGRCSPRVLRGYLSCARSPQMKECTHGKSSCRSLRRSGRRLPPKYARNSIPKIDHYPDGMTRRRRAIDFKPGQLLGSVSGELGLRKFLEKAGHTLVVTSDKDGPNSTFEKELPDAEIVISQPFWPAYMTKERFDKAKKLKLVITAGYGSDHTDLQAAMEKGVTVAEVTYCNSLSVSEHIVMMILALVRNYIPSYGWVVRGGWNIADCVGAPTTSKA